MLFYTEPGSARRFTEGLEGHPRRHPRQSPRNIRFVSSASFTSSISFTSNQSRTLLRSPNSQPPSFQSFPHSLHNTPGGGGAHSSPDVKTCRRYDVQTFLEPSIR